MALRLIVAFIVALHVAVIRAADYDLTSSQSWGEPYRTKYCPVHAPFSISSTDKSVSFAPPRRGAFSIVETSVMLPSDHNTAGLRLKVSAAGSTMPSFWRLSLRMDYASNRYDSAGKDVRFVAPFEVPGGAMEKTVFLPWTSFGGQKLRAGGIDLCEGSSEEKCVLKPEKMTHISLLWARTEGIEEPTLTLHGSIVATSSTEVDAQGTTDAECACDSDCLHCMALKWAPLVGNSCSSSTTWDMCLAVRRSLAERVIAALGDNCALPGAADARKWLSSTIDVTTCAKGSSALLATVMGDVLNGVFSVALPGSIATCSDSNSGVSGGFVGPFVGWGISGHNDLASYESQTVDSCLAKCRADERCKSVDYGARDRVQGECWLSTQDRFSAASSYSSRWDSYDYYEVVSTSNNGTKVSSGSMANALSAEQRAALLEGVPDEECCGAPDSCISKAIAAGAPAYNSGDMLGCFVIYHATAERLAGCPVVGDNSLPDAAGMMQAIAKTSEVDSHSGHAAWRLRYAFDTYITMFRYSDPESPQCKLNQRAASIVSRTGPSISTSKSLGSDTSGGEEKSLGSPPITGASGTVLSSQGSLIFAVSLPLSMVHFFANRK